MRLSSASIANQIWSQLKESENGRCKLNQIERFPCFLEFSSYTMTIKIAFTVLFFTMISGCGPQLDSAVEKENSIMLSQVEKNAQSEHAKPLPVARKKNFDINVKTWPVDVATTDPVILARAVSSLQVDRQPSKFETTAEYKARIAEIRSTVLYDDVVVGGAFAIDGGPVTYNADAGSVSYHSGYAIGYSSTGSIKVHGESASPESLSSRERAWDDYYKREKFKTITHSRAVYLSSKAFKPFAKVIVEKKMSREVAKTSIDDLRVVFVGSIIPPYFYTGDGPSQDNENNIEHRTLIEFDIKGVWLVNFKTGEILSRKFKNCEITAHKC